MNTLGWDAIFGIKSAALNALLRKGASQLLQTFQYSDHGYTLKGSFGPWEVVTGGTAKFLHVRIPVVQGTMVDASGVSTPLDGEAVYVAIALALLPNAHGQGGTSLSFDFSGQSGSGAKPVAALSPPTGSAPSKLDSTGQAILRGAVAATLAANAAQVTLVLAAINPQPGAGSWLTPQQTDFCWVESAGQGFLFILTVMDGRDTSTLNRAVDPLLLANASAWDACVALSPEMFLEHLVLPGLPPTLGIVASPGVFGWDAASGHINQTSSFPLPTVRGTFNYTPFVDALMIEVVGTQLHSVISGTCDLKVRLTLNFSREASNSLQFIPSKQILTLLPDDQAIVHSDIPTDGPFSRARKALVPNAIPAEVIQGLVLNDRLSPSVTIPSVVNWGNQLVFTATAAGLDTAFYLQGSLT